MVNLDPWQMLGLGLTYILMTCSFFIFLHFFNKLLHVRQSIKELLPFFGLMITFLCTGIAFLAASWFDFFRWQDPDNIILPLYKLYTCLMSGGLAGLGFLCEYVLKKTKYIITLSNIAGIIAIICLNTTQQLNIVSILVFVPVGLTGPFIFYFILIRKTSGFLRQRMYLALGGLLIAALGLLGRNDLFIEFVGRFFYSVATAFLIIGVCLMGYGFAAFSTFTDINWTKKLRELFVISNSGTCLFAFSFDHQSQIGDSDLIAGGLSGIQSVLSEIIKTPDNLRLIDYQNVKIMVEQGSLALFILIIKEESTFLQHKLHLFATEFETIFKEILQKWTGSTDSFHLTKILIHRFFETEPTTLA